jgi:hypothetical protein
MMAAVPVLRRRWRYLLSWRLNACGSGNSGNGHGAISNGKTLSDCELSWLTND